VNPISGTIGLTSGASIFHGKTPRESLHPRQLRRRRRAVGLTPPGLFVEPKIGIHPAKLGGLTDVQHL